MRKEHKPKLLSPDIFGWGRGLPHERVGAEEFGMSLETRKVKLFGRDIPGFCWDFPAAPEKFEKEKFVLNFWPHIFGCCFFLRFAACPGLIRIFRIFRRFY